MLECQVSSVCVGGAGFKNYNRLVKDSTFLFGMFSLWDDVKKMYDYFLT